MSLFKEKAHLHSSWASRNGERTDLNIWMEMEICTQCVCHHGKYCMKQNPTHPSHGYGMAFTPDIGMTPTENNAWWTEYDIHNL